MVVNWPRSEAVHIVIIGILLTPARTFLAKSKCPIKKKLKLKNFSTSLSFAGNLGQITRSGTAVCAVFLCVNGVAARVWYF